MSTSEEGAGPVGAPWAAACRGRSRPAGSERAGMAGRGESLSMFVVQRTFTTVRRGYDPAEVDRHLELVSRWFTRTDAGEALSRERGELRERERAVADAEERARRALEGAQMEADATLEGAARRVAAEEAAAEQDRAAAAHELTTARAEAERAVTAAQDEAVAIVAAAREEAE